MSELNKLNEQIIELLCEKKYKYKEEFKLSEFIHNNNMNKNNNARLNTYITLDIPREWDNITIINTNTDSIIKIKLNNNSIKSNDEKRTEYYKNKITQYIHSLPKNIKIFLHQGSQVYVYKKITELLKITTSMIIKPIFDKIKFNIKNNNFMKSTVKYNIESFKLNKPIKIGTVIFIYNVDIINDTIKIIIKFDWKTKNIQNFMNMLLYSNVKQNDIIDDLYAKIFCINSNENNPYTKIDDIDQNCEKYYNLLKNKNLSKITKNNIK